MITLEEARSRIRGLVEPLRHRLGAYEVREQLGHSTFVGGTWEEVTNPKHWHDAETKHTVTFRVTTTSAYPVQQYDGVGYSKEFHITSLHSRGDAIVKAEVAVRNAMPQWKQAIDLDDAFKLGIGRQVLLLKRYYDMRQGTLTEYFEEGSLGEVVGHQPAWLYVLFGERQPVPIPTWMFTNAHTKVLSKAAFLTGPETLQVPDPHIEFVDGFKPWGHIND
jgi:hypothetical protein